MYGLRQVQSGFEVIDRKSEVQISRPQRPHRWIIKWNEGKISRSTYSWCGESKNLEWRHL